MTRLPAVAAVCLLALTATGSASAAFPGSNGKIFYSSGAGGAEIWSIAPDGTGLTNLTQHGDAETTAPPIPGPDGKKILYGLGPTDGQPGFPESRRGLWLMNPDGSDKTQVVNTPAGGGGHAGLAWSWDGTELVYSAYTGDFFTGQQELFAMNADGTNVRQITFTTDVHEFPYGWKAPTDADTQTAPRGTILYTRTPKEGSDRSATLWSMPAPATPAGSGTPQQLTTPASNLNVTSADYSPDGARVVFTRGTALWVMNADGTAQTQIGGSGLGDPQFSPDGTRILVTAGTPELSILDTQGTLISTIDVPDDARPDPGTLAWAVGAPDADIEVQITPVGAAAADETFQLTLTLKNTSATEALEAVTPVNPYGFGVASDYYPAGQQGEIRVVSGPEPAFPSTLAAGQSSVHTVTLRATRPGKVGLEAKVAARGADADKDVEDTHYGEVEIAENQPLEAERTAMVASGVALFFGHAKRVLREQQSRYAKAIFNALKSRLSGKVRKFYFGAKDKLKVSPLERSLARWRAQSPDLTALVTPNKHKLYKDGFAYLTPEQFARYEQQSNAEEFAKFKAYLGKKLAPIGFELRYWGQLASEEGQGRLAADIARWHELNREDDQYLLEAFRMSFSQQESRQALVDANKQIEKGFEKVVNGLIKARDARITKLEKLAETDPDAFIGQLAKDDAALGVEGWKLVIDQVFGDAQDRFGGKLLKGAAAAMGKFGDAIGLTEAKQARALARTLPLSDRSATLGPSFMDDLSEDAKTMIDLRKMEAIGGMPVADVEISKEIVAQVNARMRQAGHNVEVEALFRPASPYRVPGSFAKVETVGVKNVSAMDLALGAPPSLLAETAIFKPIQPEKLAGFKNYPEVEQILLKERYKTRLDEYNQFHGLEPVTDKKMKEMLKAFSKVHTFDQIGKGRTIKMKLSSKKVGDATVLKYDYLKVEDKVLINGQGKPRSIGTDYDRAALINKETREPLKGQALSVAEFEFNRLGEKAAIEKGYANPFHGATAHGTDANAAEYPFFAHFWLAHLKEKQALQEAERLAANYNRGIEDASKHVTAAGLLSKTNGLFERHLLRVSASDASFGPANVLFRTPVVAP